MTEDEMSRAVSTAGELLSEAEADSENMKRLQAKTDATLKFLRTQFEDLRRRIEGDDQSTKVQDEEAPTTDDPGGTKEDLSTDPGIVPGLVAALIQTTEALINRDNDTIRERRRRDLQDFARTAVRRQREAARIAFEEGVDFGIGYVEANPEGDRADLEEFKSIGFRRSGVYESLSRAQMLGGTGIVWNENETDDRPSRADLEEFTSRQNEQNQQPDNQKDDEQ